MSPPGLLFSENLPPLMHVLLNAVFNTLWKFIEELRKVYSDYRLQQERAAKQARKEAAEAEAKAKKAAAAAAKAAKH